MSDPTNDRKLSHLRIVGDDPGVDRNKGYFDTIRLIHRALPEIDLESIDTSTRFMGKSLAFPLLISSMTGGDADELRAINHNLAIAAEQTGVALGVGSQRVMFSHPGARESFALRSSAPRTLLLGNLGAVNLGRDDDLDRCRDAVDVLNADGLFLHLNPLQEAAQPEGCTRFAGIAARMGHIAAHLDVPVIAKEVGAGISSEDIDLLLQQGISTIDIAGTGGTSWARVEYHRHPEHVGCSVGRLFQDWGWPTPHLLHRLRAYRDRVTFVASGGVRTGIDMVKSLILGASLCGIARPLLQPARTSADAVIRVIESLRCQFRTAMFLMGVDRVDNLAGNDALVADWGDLTPPKEG